MSAADAPERVTVTTASGSRYAVCVTSSSRWWVRAQVVVSFNAPLLEDVWRPIAPITPWPPLLRMGLALTFRDERAIAWPERPDLMIGCTHEWRHTTPIESIAPWGLDDEWPGEPPAAAGLEATP